MGEDLLGRSLRPPGGEIPGRNHPSEGKRAWLFAQGTPKGLELYMMIRLANVLKIPHVVTPGSICHMPRETASLITCGFFPVPDYDHPPALVLVWGSNLFQTNEEGIIGSQLRRALDQGAKLVTIDPRKTALGFQVRSLASAQAGNRPGLGPGDAEGDRGGKNSTIRNFVKDWTVGFEELEKELKNYSLREFGRRPPGFRKRRSAKRPASMRRRSPPASNGEMPWSIPRTASRTRGPS